jgi:hypothetical protein
MLKKRASSYPMPQKSAVNEVEDPFEAKDMQNDVE